MFKVVMVRWGMVEVNFWGSGANKKTDTLKNNILCYQWLIFPFCPYTAETRSYKPLFYGYLPLDQYLMLDGRLVKVLGLVLVLSIHLYDFSSPVGRPNLNIISLFLSLNISPRLSVFYFPVITQQSPNYYPDKKNFAHKLLYLNLLKSFFIYFHFSYWQTIRKALDC